MDMVISTKNDARPCAILQKYVFILVQNPRTDDMLCKCTKYS